MAAEVVSFEQLFEVKWHANVVELESMAKQVQPWRVDVSVNVIDTMEKLNCSTKSFKDFDNFLVSESPLAKWFPVWSCWGCLHLNVDQGLIYNVVSVYVDKVGMSHLA